MLSNQLENLVEQMVAAALDELKTGADHVRQTLNAEFTKLGNTMAFIESRLAQGTITPANAKAMFAAQANTAGSVLLVAEELSVQAAQDAINAALAAVRGAVGKALGFDLF